MQVRKQHLELDMNNRLVPLGKGVRQGCILSPCLFNFYAEYIKQNAGLDTSQARIKIAGRNNNLKYADESESESHSTMSDSLQPHGLYVACQVPLSMEFSRPEYWSG